MTNRKKHYYLAMMAACTLIAALFTSCVRQGSRECPVVVSFNYSYNIKNANAFGVEISKVGVWLFDENGVFVKRYVDEGGHIDNDYRMSLTDLKPAVYTLVAWARGVSQTDDYANYAFPDLIPGVSTIDELNPRIKKRDGNITDTKFNPMLSGTCRLDYSDYGSVHCRVDMIKCTNKLRVLLMPIGDQLVSADDYDFIIEDENGWLDYRAEKYMPDELNYKPYHTETLFPPEAARSGDGMSVAVASMNTSRLFYDDSQRFVVADKATGEEKFVLENLTWYLALLATLEHNDKWSPQEYLDREDYYNITIYVNRDTFINNTIVIKDWVISIDDDINLEPKYIRIDTNE